MDDAGSHATTTPSAGDGWSPRPVVVLHGSYHRPEHFRDLVSALEGAGHAVAVPDIGGRHLSVQIDIAQQVVDGFDTAPVVVAHSFGGAVAGCLRGMSHVIFLSAWVLDDDESAAALLEPFADTAAARAFLGALSPADDAGLLQLDPDVASALFYGRCSPVVAERAIGLLRPDTGANFAAVPPRVTWRDHPTTYLRPDDDRTWPPDLLDRFAARADAVVDVEAADHSVWLSRPDVVTGLIHDLA